MCRQCCISAKRSSELNAFKKEMQSKNVLSVDPGAEDTYQGNAMMVFDSSYIEAAGRIERSLELLRSFYPFIMLILAAAGAVSSYLLLQSRQMEADLMRILGTGSHTVSMMFTVEQIVLGLTGCIAGVVLSVVSGTSVAGREIWMIGVFLFAYIVGAVVAVKSMDAKRISVGKES